MTKMAGMPIYGKNLKKISSPEPKGLWPWNLVYSIGCSSTTKFVQMLTLGWPWPILQQGQIWSHTFLFGKKVKTMEFSETIVVYDINVGRCSKLNEDMNLYEYQRSRSFIDLPRSLRVNIFKLLFLRKVQGWLKPNFMWSHHGMGKRKFVQMVQVTLPVWLPCSYMVKSLKSLLFWNQMYLKSWYAASGTWVLPSLFKWWPWVELDLFYGKVKFGPLCFCLGKG